MDVHRSFGLRAATLLFLCIILLPSPTYPGEARLRLEEPTGLERKAWPVEIGLPFKRGEVHDASTLRILSPTGTNLPVQAAPLSRWPDGSVRWAHIFFFADLKAQKTEFWKVLWNSPLPPAQPATTVKVTRSSPGLTVSTGPLEAQLALSGKGIFRRVRVGGVDILKPGEGGAFRVVDGAGSVFESVLADGEGPVIEEEGPLRTTIRLRGKHRSDGGRSFLDYSIRLVFLSGKSWCEVEHEFTNREESEWSSVREMTCEFPLNPAKGFRGTTSEFKIEKFWEFDRPFRIYSGKDDLFGVFSGARIFLNDTTEIVGTGYESEARARFWADASDRAKGVTVSIQEMSNNYPKGVRIGPGGVTVDLYPGTEPVPLKFHQGWRKRHRLLLYFHTGTPRDAHSQELAFCWQMPVVPWTELYVESGAAGPLMPYRPQKYPMIERALRDAFIAYEVGVGRGMIDYGDTRGTGSGERADFWSNNAYDTPWAAFLMYFRTGERRYWTFAQATAQHMMDIDVVHHSARNQTEIGGVRIHGPQHVQYGSEAVAGSSVSPNHEWLEGLLAAYHVSGRRDYLDAATGVADHLLRAIDAGWILPPYNARWNGARNLGWPLVALTAMYEETGEDRYLKGARRVVGGLQELQMENGSFPIWIGPYKAAAPLHNAVAMEALGRYALLTGDDRAKAMYLKCADATLHDLSFPDGDLIYITHPDYRSGYRGMPWGGFHYGYLFTHEKKYLEFPHPLIMRQLRSANLGTYGEGAFSYSARGLFYYLNYAEEAGLLTDLPPY